MIFANIGVVFWESVSVKKINVHYWVSEILKALSRYFSSYFYRFAISVILFNSATYYGSSVLYFLYIYITEVCRVVVTNYRRILVPPALTGRI